jgi:hypothetical protein
MVIRNLIANNMKKLFFSLLFYSFAAYLISGTGNEPIKSLVSNFISTDWPTVNAAKEKIENLGAAAIPEMVALMGDCEVKKLQNTGDLIYPGAEKFFGHGQIIDYEIDMVCIRAGWLLEELTFRNFGFSGIHLPSNELADFISMTFPEYLSIDDHRQQADMLDEEGKRHLIRTLSIERARTWWQNSLKQWTRLASLEQALNSQDEKSQVKALFYLRNGKTTCKGLNQKFYKSRLSRTIEKLSKSSTNRVSENAKLIMLDSDFSWLSLKPVN